MSDRRHDFDFLFGTWNVQNRRLHNPLTGSREWYTFASRATEEPVLDGLGNLEQWDADETPTGPIHAVAMRLFNIEHGTWSIFWSTAGSGTFLTPTVGRFENGVGTFTSREAFNGRTVIVRFIWTSSGPSACRWVQAFSADGGATWEDNWIMEFSRAS